MEYHFEYLQRLVAQSGPKTEDYYELDAWFAEVFEQVNNGELDEHRLHELRSILGDAISTETLQGYVYHAPRGYAGDYKILERIYNLYHSPKEHLTRWDAYMQKRPATQAVRNRKTYFVEAFKNHLTQNKTNDIEVLTLASGPAREIYETFLERPDANIHFDCVDHDGEAVEFASNLCRQYLENITFTVKNPLRFTSKKQYSFIWSAGLFDYFKDNLVVYMLKKMKSMLRDGGEIVIGNFSTANPTRSYMELFRWNLYYRSPQKLRALALESGFAPHQISIGKESTGVNLFLHIKG